jgi:hypothetical protein
MRFAVSSIKGLFTLSLLFFIRIARVRTDA